MNARTYLLLTLSLASIATGGESANYSLTPLSLEAGGSSTSANYTIDSSTSAGGAESSANYTARTGYAGSLFDTVALDLTASPLSLNEGGTRQLGASLVFDDSSLQPLDPSAVTWSVQSGPLASINSGGLASAGNVYQNTNAVAQGNYQTFADTLTLNVLNVGNDNFALYAGDGIADDWQVLYFGVNSPNAAPLLDPGNDGWINLLEYNAGLLPNDANSVFSFRMEGVPGQPAQRRIIFRPRLPGRTYTVFSSLTMQPGTWSPLAGATVSDNGDERTVTDPNAGTGRKFYRVEVQRP